MNKQTNNKRHAYGPATQYTTPEIQQCKHCGIMRGISGSKPKYYSETGSRIDKAGACDKKNYLKLICMNKLTPEEILKGYPLYTEKGIQHAVDAMKEYAAQEVAEKEKQLERAGKLLAAYRKHPTHDVLLTCDVDDFLTELKQWQ